MPIVRRSRKYRAIIGRRCDAYAPLTSGYNGLVGGSNPPGPTMPVLLIRIFNGLVRKLANQPPRLANEVFTIRSRATFSSPPARAACDPLPWYIAGPQKA